MFLLEILVVNRKISTGGGNISIGDVKNEELEVSTGGGNITIGNIGGSGESIHSWR